MREDDRDWQARAAAQAAERRWAGRSDVEERWVEGVEQATDMAWGPGGATLRSTGTYWDGPRGEPGMTLRRARCPRTEGAGCVLRAIRTESGGPTRARCLSHEPSCELRLDSCVHDSDVDRPLPRVTCSCLPGLVR